MLMFAELGGEAPVRLPSKYAPVPYLRLVTHRLLQCLQFILFCIVLLSLGYTETRYIQEYRIYPESSAFYGVAHWLDCK